MAYDDVMRLSGRELDAVVVEHVFGMKRLEGASIPFEHLHKSEPVSEQVVWLGDGERYCKFCGDLPLCSSDIAAAWKIVEYLATPDEVVMITFAKDEWIVTIGSAEVSAIGKTAAEAICRAALLAVTKEAEVGEQAAD